MSKLEELHNAIDQFSPEDGVWVKLDDLIGELWETGITEASLPHLFSVFERYPDDDGAGVLWSIVHAVEALPFSYEDALRASQDRTPSFMADIMLGRLMKATER